MNSLPDQKPFPELPDPLRDSRKFTEEDVENCWPHHISYFVELLNGDYSLEEAREDLMSLIEQGSREGNCSEIPDSSENDARE